LLEDIQAFLRGEYDPFGEETSDDEWDVELDDDAEADEEDANLPPPPPRESEWYLAIDGQQFGPYSMNVIRELVQSGQVAPATAFAWKRGMASWVPFTQIPELASLIGAPATPPPPPPPPAPGHRAAPSAGQPPGGAFAGPESEPVVDINTASGDMLVEVLGLTPDDADRIVREREAIGGFASPEQVGEFLGLKPHQVIRLRKSARFSSIPKRPGRGRMVDY